MWGLACVTYEAATGAKLFDVAAAAEVVARRRPAQEPAASGSVGLGSLWPWQLQRGPTILEGVEKLHEWGPAPARGTSGPQGPFDEELLLLKLMVEVLGPAPCKVGPSYQSMDPACTDIPPCPLSFKAFFLTNGSSHIPDWAQSWRGKVSAGSNCRVNPLSRCFMLPLSCWRLLITGRPPQAPRHMRS